MSAGPAPAGGPGGGPSCLSCCWWPRVLLGWWPKLPGPCSVATWPLLPSRVSPPCGSHEDSCHGTRGPPASLTHPPLPQVRPGVAAGPRASRNGALSPAQAWCLLPGPPRWPSEGTLGGRDSRPWQLRAAGSSQTRRRVCPASLGLSPGTPSSGPAHLARGPQKAIALGSCGCRGR